MTDPREVPKARTVTGYALEEEIGSGRRGTTFRARKEGRCLALKIVGSEVPIDLSSLHRLERTSEAEIRHPNVLRLEEVGEDGGRRFYSMPLLGGDSLRGIIDDLIRGSSERPSLSPLAMGPAGDRHPEFYAHAARLFAEVAEGLAAMHREGIAHLRLTPNNLIFSPAGRLVMTDFGGRADAEDPCTLPYTAPEALIGAGEAAGPLSDVYSLGANLYELVTLRAPHEGSDVRELRRSVLAGRIRRPRSIREDIPPPLETCILHALERRPDRRYTSALALAADLRRILRGEQPLALDGEAIREKVLTRRSRLSGLPARVTAAVVLSALLCIIVFSGYRLRRAQKADEIASGALAHLERRQYDEAIEAAGRLTAMNPGHATSRAVHEIVARTARSEAAIEHFGRAILALGRGEAEPALAEIERARALLPRGMNADDLAAEIRRLASADPLEEILADGRPPLRAAALEVLRDEVAEGRRAAGDLQLARAALRDPHPAVRRSAFQLFASLQTSDPLLDAIGLSRSGELLRIDTQTFACLHGSLWTIGDQKAREMISRWSFDQMQRLDRAPVFSTLDLAPNLQVQVSPDGAREFTRQWLASAAACEPDLLVARAMDLVDQEELGRPTILALAQLEPRRSADLLSQIAVRHSARHGVEAIRALASQGATPALASLAHGRISTPLRALCLEALARSDEPEALCLIEATLMRSSEADLRRRALDLLASRQGGGWDPSAALLGALDDPALRDRAMEWWNRLDARLRADLSLSLVSHPHDAVRDRAAEILSEEAAATEISRLLLGLLHRSPDVRKAALRLLLLRLRPGRWLPDLGSRLETEANDIAESARSLFDRGAEWWMRVSKYRISLLENFSSFRDDERS